MLNPQEKATLEIQPSINNRNENTWRQNNNDDLGIDGKR